jgi:hypothetical protein
MFNPTPSYFAIQPTTPLTPSLYFLLLPSLLLLLKILLSPLTNFLSSLHFHQSSIYIHIHFLFPVSFCPPLFTIVSIPLIILQHHFHPYSTQLNSQLTSVLPPRTQLPLLLSTYLCLSSPLSFLPASPNFLQSPVYILLLLPKSHDCSPSPSPTPLSTAPVTSYCTVSCSTDTVTVPPPVTSTLATLHFHTTHWFFTAPAPDVTTAPQVPKFSLKIIYPLFPFPINTLTFHRSVTDPVRVLSSRSRFHLAPLCCNPAPPTSHQYRYCHS